MRKEAYLVKPLSDGAVQCQVCAHSCAIQPGESGKCGVRRNFDGTLYLVVYGEAIAIHVDPIEKKPLFHFMPRGDILSIGTYGCNFRCSFCQNWQMSQARGFDDQRDYIGQRAPPETLVNICVRDEIPMIAYTYNEPTVFFEYTYDTAKLAYERGIKNVYVSNGFMSRAALDMVEPYLDGINVDLKAFNDGFYRDRCQARLEPVKRNIAHITRETDIWIEVTTLTTNYGRWQSGWRKWTRNWSGMLPPSIQTMRCETGHGPLSRRWLRRTRSAKRLDCIMSMWAT
jgi:pyruvate formate lyase activating enzyme